MNRSWNIWCVLLVCAVVILGTMAWMTRGVIHSEEDRVQAQAHAQISERIGLALSRMDTIGAALLVVENQRPPLHYDAFFSPEDFFTAQDGNVYNDQVLQASPLLTEDREMVKLHFEIRPDGSLHSPQVPSEARLDLAKQFGIDEDSLAVSKEMFAELALLFLEKSNENQRLLQVACSNMHAGWNVISPTTLSKEANLLVNNGWGSVPQTAFGQNSYNNALQTTEQAERSKVVSKEVQKASNRSLKKRKSAPSKKKEIAQNDIQLQLNQTREELAGLTPFQPVWLKGELFLSRQVQGSRSVKYQGVWLDHQKLHAELSAQIPQELEGVTLVPVLEPTENPMNLVSLPWRLEKKELPRVGLPANSPVYQTLIVGWVAALGALVALFVLLRGVLKLSERRAAFVSSVTHELRTPLTTFRLYSEMLADGMVSDEVKTQEYLRTMLSESERLNHLVENVLSYSRIERGNARSHSEKLSVADLIERIRPVLQRRVDQEEAALSIVLDDELGDLATDVTAVEQILFNLVDNACKYGLSESGNSRITLSAKRNRRGLILEVSDEGKGVASQDRKRLFRAFHKSAQDAAYSKPGVGLGLALCRRLARALGGDLKVGKNAGKGASFLLTIPAS